MIQFSYSSDTDMLVTVFFKQALPKGYKQQILSILQVMDVMKLLWLLLYYSIGVHRILH